LIACCDASAERSLASFNVLMAWKSSTSALSSTVQANLTRFFEAGVKSTATRILA